MITSPSRPWAHYRSPMSPERSAWPDLPLDAWRDTYATLHLWTQIVGKVRLAQTPWVNHSWHVTLYVTARGLDDIADSPRPAGVRDRVRLRRPPVDDRVERRPRPTPAARPQSVATSTAPDGGAGGARPAGAASTPGRTRSPTPSPSIADEAHRSYDPRVRRPLLAGAGPGRPGLEDLSVAVHGQVQPGAFFLGGAGPGGHALFRPARSANIRAAFPNLPDWVAREAYSHEVSSCGFWAGGGPIAYPVFYSYAYPEPAGFRGRARAAGRSVLQPGASRVPPALRSRQARRLSRRHAAGVPAIDVRGGGHAGELGSQSLERPVDPRLTVGI